MDVELGLIGQNLKAFGYHFEKDYNNWKNFCKGEISSDEGYEVLVRQTDEAEKKVMDGVK